MWAFVITLRPSSSSASVNCSYFHLLWNHWTDLEDHPVIISIMLQFHRPSSFWQEDFQSFNQSEHIIGPGSHVGFPICTKITNLVEDHPMNISAKFGPNLFSGFRDEDENMKSLQTWTTATDAKWWQKLTWPFGSVYTLTRGPLDSEALCFSLSNL
jgi:hypothetical protein